MSDVDVDDQYIDKSVSWTLTVPVAWHVTHERTIALTTPCDTWTIQTSYLAIATDGVPRCNAAETHCVALLCEITVCNVSGEPQHNQK
jgi:hypothetical protein